MLLWDMSDGKTLAQLSIQKFLPLLLLEDRSFHNRAQDLRSAFAKSVMSRVCFFISLSNWPPKLKSFEEVLSASVCQNVQLVGSLRSQTWEELKPCIKGSPLTAFPPLVSVISSRTDGRSLIVVSGFVRKTAFSAHTQVTQSDVWCSFSAND